MVFIGSPEKVIKHVSVVSSILFAVIGFALIYIDNNLPRKNRGSRIWFSVMAIGSGVFLLVALLEEATILEFGVPLMEQLAIVLLLLLLFVRSDLVSTYRRGVATRTDLLWLILIFGALSIYGTFRGFNFEGVSLNVRDLGPIIAGLIGGSLAGAAAGSLAGLYRDSLGDWIALPCAVAMIIAGVLGGVVGRAYPVPSDRLYLLIENQYRREIDMTDLVCWIRKEIDPELEMDDKES